MRWLVAALLACGCDASSDGGVSDSGSDGADSDSADPAGDRDYPTFTPCPAELAFVPQAQCIGGTLQLTTDATDLRGAAWLTVPYPTNVSISQRLTILFSNTTVPGDGMAIVMQNDPRGVAALGETGGGLAYASITPSIALELDTFSNNGELGGAHVGLDIDGVVYGAAAAELTPFVISNGTPFTVWFDYNKTTHVAGAFIAQTQTKPATPLLTVTSDLARLGSQMWLGLTAATGGNHNAHRVLAWRIDVTP